MTKTLNHLYSLHSSRRFFFSLSTYILACMVVKTFFSSSFSYQPKWSHTQQSLFLSNPLESLEKCARVTEYS